MNLKKIIKNILPLLFGNGAIAICSIISVPFIIDIYGISDYGYYAALIVLINLINTIVNLQPWQSMIQFWFESNNESNKKLILTLCIVSDLVSAILAATIFFFLHNMILGFSNLMVFDDETLVMVISMFILSYQTSFYISTLRIQSKYKVQATVDTLESILRLAVVLFFSYFYISNSIIDLAIAYFLTGILGNFTRFIIGVIYAREFNFKSRIVFDAQLSRKFIKYSYWVYLKSLIDLPVTHLDRIIVNTVLGSNATALLDILKKMVGLISFIIRPISQVLLPEITKYVKEGNSRLAYEISIKNSIKLLVIFFVVILSGFFIESKANILGFLGLDIISEYFMVSLAYVLTSSLSISFIFIHILFMAEGLVAKDAKNLIVANVIYLVVLLSLIGTLEMSSLIVALLIQSIIIILYKVRMLTERL
ncbi:lipopolysaccharide biosynthesis protein [Vibrio cyclitrophicus]|uniref:lipopolysaccharide biosynthesis protein n=1 Tax=Vibrio cyclitrophicus TaxID=47951 RepID=UPI000C8263FF|nr:oligosaccharide flippase family protein [Vibrio cyclitrophicus]PMH46922.1 hypothetical protein BCU67_21415 [Vibrio cyclitrophicus]